MEPYKNKKVYLMMTCLCDAFFSEVAKSTVEVLEHLGCEIIVPEDQTCCGQPAFNSGDWESSRKIARHTAQVFKGEYPIIIPSGSCAHMIQHGNSLAFEKETDCDDVKNMAARTYEISDYIVNVLGIKEWGGELNAKIALHKSCHTRGTCVGDSTETLLKSIKGIEILPLNQPEQCCGFGGTFSVKFPNISSAMGEVKIEKLLEMKPDYVASTDMSCLMHQNGLAEKKNIPYEPIHVVQLLNKALK